MVETNPWVPAMVADMDGVASDELRSGDGFGHDWGSALRWFSIKAEGLGGSARSCGVWWWRWADRRGSNCGERSWDVAAAEPTGVGEDGFPLTIANYRGAMGVA